MSVVVQKDFEDILRHAAGGRHRLALVVGEACSGKTTLLRDIAAAYAMRFVSLGVPLGVRLQELSPRMRPLAIEDAVRQLFDGDTKGVCMDNTDILFDPALRCDPLRLALGISQNTSVVFSLMGRIEGRRFVRGYPDHPEFYSDELPFVPLVTLDGGGSTLHAF
jgi:hypothetical protein